MLYGSSVANRLPAPLATFIRQLEHSSPETADQAVELLSALDLPAERYAPWFDFNHSPADSYGRLQVARGENFELMVMSWAPGDYSAIHDHGAAEWGAVRYFGPADHRIFSLDSQKLAQTDVMTMSTGDVLGVDHALIHLMGNPSDKPMISLHLYGRAEKAEQITGNARIFDLIEQQIQRTDGGVFFCLPESEIHSREPGPSADAQTTLLHHRLMLARIQRMPNWHVQPKLAAKADALRSAINRLSGERSTQAEQADEC